MSKQIQGNFLITGGMGELGLVFAGYLAKDNSGTIVLVGRSKENEKITGKLKELNGLGAKVIYLPCDIANRDSVLELSEAVRKECGHLDGIIHAAGVHNDAFFIKKKDEDFEKVLSVKVDGTRWLDEVFASEKLSYFILFSSISAVFGNVGQTDYSYANSYMDSFAAKRDKMVQEGLRYGRSISISWPLWDRGMSMDEAARKAVERSIGVLSEEEGLRAFEEAIKQPNSHFIVLKAKESDVTGKKETVSSKENTNTSDPKLEGKINDYIKGILSEQTGIPKSRIKDRESFESYGIDSVVIMSITGLLEEKIGQVPKTLFFEYENVEALTGYFASTKQSEFKTLFGIADEKESSPAQNVSEAKETQKVSGSWCSGKVQKSVESHAESRESEDDIAIIGISGHYPGSPTLDKFWENLKNGADLITEIPAHRWNKDTYFDPEKGKIGKAYCKWGGFIDDVEMFDSMFFRIPPMEAKFHDPHGKLLIQTAWEALEDAGYTSQELKDEKVGVYAGAMYTNYQLYVSEEYGSKINGISQLSNIANRISYLMDFKGPSITMDTMCSSVLTALSLACENIKNGQATMALVGGVNLSLHPVKYNMLCQQGFLSSDGRCKSFGEGGNGYVPGEGVGAIILKPLKRAEKDGDQIYGVVRAARVNAGGKTNGYTVPSVDSQKKLISETLNDAGIDAGTITAVEAHGTGTALGDPIEVDALSRVFDSYGVPRNYCSLGSVKSNIGHLEAAAGIAAITKVLLEMKHGKLVPTLHSEKPNPYIPFAESPFYLQHELSTWNRLTVNGQEIPRRAGISAFGAGGSNAHVILEEYIDKRNPDKDMIVPLFVLSARTEEQLKEYAGKMISFLENLEGKDKESDVLCTQKNTDYSFVKEILSKVLDISEDAISADDRLLEIGIDKYVAEDMTEAVRDTADKQVLSEDILACETVADLAELFEKTIGNTSEDSSVKTEDDESGEIRVPSLEQIAYTLQTGRITMEVRLAIEANSKEELISALNSYIQDKDDESYKTGDIADNTDKLEKLFASKGVREFLLEQLRKGELSDVADYYVLGADIPWKELYQGVCPGRVSLPTYPFAKERCWILPDDGTGCLCPDEAVNTSVAASIYQSMENSSGFRCTGDTEDIQKGVIDWLKKAFAEVLGIPISEIHEKRTYEAYGIDSIHIEQFNHYLGKYIEGLPSTLLFTYDNIKKLAAYLTQNHLSKMQSILGISGGEEAKTAKEIPAKISVSGNTGSKENAAFEDGIAIIGIYGRFPKAENLDEFLDNLENGKDCISEIPAERWDYRKYPNIECKWGGFIDGYDEFDPRYFGIAPSIAYFMEPQERLFVEAVESCMEDAGYTSSGMENKDEFDSRGQIAVYAGVSFNEYGLYGAGEIARGKTTTLNSQIYSVANRVSYLFNFGGPSLSVDSACSSSLYALHLACNSLISGDAKMAIAGGVNLSLHPSKYLTLDKGKFLSTDGHCHTFGKGGEGYVPGEGVGAVLLKPYKEAVNDHDHIYAVIKGSAVNHGGKTYAYSVPNPVAQSKVIEKALKKAKVNPRTIGYVEAHGTGTSLGDPIEVNALSEVYKKYSKDTDYCSIGSVKSNIGHLEAAAGISQLIKVILQLKKGELFPSRLNSEEINPNIDFSVTPFHVQMERGAWNRQVVDGIEYPRRAGISSFGVGGVNVHVIVEESKEVNAERPKMSGDVMIPFSGKTKEALSRNLENMLRFLESGKKLPDLRDLSFTLITGRTHQPNRLSFTVSDYDEFKDKLRQAIDGKDLKGIYTGKVSEDVPEGQIDNSGSASDMAKAYVSGNSFGFVCETKGYIPYRVSLPTYSFEKEKYWMYNKYDSEMADENGVSSPASENDSYKQKGEFLQKIKDAFPYERKEMMVGFLQLMFAGLLGFANGQVPDAEEGFFSMGLESIMTEQAIQIIEENLGITIEEQDLFEYPNINKLADHLLDQAVESQQADDETEHDESEKEEEINLDDMTEEELVALLKSEMGIVE